MAIPLETAQKTSSSLTSALREERDRKQTRKRLERMQNEGGGCRRCASHANVVGVGERAGTKLVLARGNDADKKGGKDEDGLFKGTSKNAGGL